MKSLEFEWKKIESIESSKGSKPIPRSSHDVSIYKNQLLVFGGENIARVPINSTLHCLDLTTFEWSILHPKNNASAPGPRVAHCQCVVGDKLYIFGGREGITMQEKPLNDLHYFDLVSREWVQVNGGGLHPSKRSFHKMVTDGTRFIYVFGGCGEEGRLNDLHCFDTLEETWSKLPLCQEVMGRGGACLGVNEHNILVTCGFSGNENNDVYLYNIKNQEWKVVTKSDSNIRPRSVCATATVKGNFIIFGGEVDPSQKGHEGAGGFANDLVVLSLDSGSVIPCSTVSATTSTEMAPCARGWTSMAAKPGDENLVYLFGGLSGDDNSPIRLDDIWQLRLI